MFVSIKIVILFIIKELIVVIFIIDGLLLVIFRENLLKEEKYEEALKMLRTVEGDERSLNALGVALYMTGHKEQALGCFRRAAEKGNAEAQDNLRQLTE